MAGFRSLDAATDRDAAGLRAVFAFSLRRPRSHSERKVFAGAKNMGERQFPEGWCAETSRNRSHGHGGRAQNRRGRGRGGKMARITPCRGCRQRLRNSARPRLSCIFAIGAAFWRRIKLGDLLPNSFGLG